MLSQSVREQLDRMNGTSYKLGLGGIVSSVESCVKGLYDFSKQGGAIGSVVLVDELGAPVVIPKGALITQSYLHVSDAVLSLGAATVALHLQSAGDVLAATAKASFSTGANLAGVEDNTVTNMLLLTADRQLEADIAVAALTAGKISVFVKYVLP